MFTSNVNADISDLFKQLEEVVGKSKSVEASDSAKTTLENTLDAVDVGPNGIEADCKSINWRSSDDKFNIKSSEWTQDTVSFLIKKVESCEQIKIAVAGTKYPGQIDSAKKDAEWSKLSINRKYEEVSQQKERDRKSEESGKKLLALEQCRSNDDYELFKSQNAVIEYHKAVEDLKQAQKKEREISKESGVRDLGLERNLGFQIVTYRDLRDANFKQYKKLGGKAASAEKVTRDLSDPCT